MPGKGYATLGLKPSTWSRLTNITDTFYPGMFLPSTLIILMNEVKLERYSVKMYPHRLDLTGKYNTITIRSDIKAWIDQNYESKKEEYEERYHVKSYLHFVGYFLANLFESKFASQESAIKLSESDFEWLQTEYEKYKKTIQGNHISGNKTVVREATTFDMFADMYINDMLRKMRAAREILSARL